MKKIFFIVTSILFFDFFCFGETEKIDSLLKILQTSEDSSKVEALNELCWELKFSDFFRAIKFCERGIELSEKINFQKGLATGYNNIAVVYANRADYEKAIDFFLRSLKIREKIAEKNNNSADDMKGISYTLNNLGNIYRMQGNYDMSLNYLNQSLKIKERLNDRQGIAQSFLNIGSLYNSKTQYDSAIHFFSESLKRHKETANNKSIAHVYNNLALSYQYKKDFEKALKYYNESLKIKLELAEDKLGIGHTWNNMASIYLEQKKLYGKAIEYSSKALAVAEELGAKSLMKHCFQNLSSAYHGLGDFKKAFDYLQKYSTIKDTILNEENSKIIAEMSSKYEWEKKEKEIELLKKQEEIQKLALSKQEAELNKQKTVIWSAVLGLLLFAGFLFFIFNAYKQKKKANAQLAKKNTEITHRKKEIEEQKEEILSSIRYAKRIQQAVLKAEKKVTSHLPDHFVLFKPKDIVSGDFYWAVEKHAAPLPPEGGKIYAQAGSNVPGQLPPSGGGGAGHYWYVAAADCTGHGVPGAFLTMLGMSFLNEITIGEKIMKPSEILDELRNRIIKELGQTGKDGESKDGMDISLLQLDLKGFQNLSHHGNTVELQWAGANNSLNFIRGGELKEIKADKQPVGYFPEPKPFTNHKIQLQKNDSIYIFSDGYADQFGGSKGKKFKYSQLEKLLVSIYEKPMEEQKEILNETIESWKGILEQVDDICIIGVRV